MHQFRNSETIHLFKALSFFVCDQSAVICTNPCSEPSTRETLKEQYLMHWKHTVVVLKEGKALNLDFILFIEFKIVGKELEFLLVEYKQMAEPGTTHLRWLVMTIGDHWWPSIKNSKKQIVLKNTSILFIALIRADFVWHQWSFYVPTQSWFFTIPLFSLLVWPKIWHPPHSLKKKIQNLALFTFSHNVGTENFGFEGFWLNFTHILALG